MAMDDDALRQMVREEAQRMQIRSALTDELAPKAEEPPKKSLFRTMVEHPAGRLVFGFILTGVIGQWLSWTYAERKEEERLQRSALEAVREFSTLEQRRRASYIDLRAAILNNTLDDLPALRAAYQEANVEWRAQLQAQRLQFREFFGFARRHPIEISIDVDFVDVWRKLDKCLSDAVQFSVRGERPRALRTLRECGGAAQNSGTLLQTASNCAYELSSSLNQSIMNGHDCADPFWRDDGARSYAQLSDICDPVRVAQPKPAEDVAWRYKTPRENALKYWPYSIPPAARKAASGEEAERIAKLDRVYDALCVKDDLGMTSPPLSPKHPTPVFRPARDSDIAAVIALWDACGLLRPWNPPEADIAMARSGAHSDVLVAWDETALMAAFMIGQDGHRAWVYYLGVAPALQGSGLGRAAMAAAEDWARAQHMPKVHLMVRRDNSDVLNFYDRLGYHQSDTVLLEHWIDPERGALYHQ